MPPTPHGQSTGAAAQAEGMAFTLLSFFFFHVWVFLILGAVGPWPVLTPFPSHSPQPFFSCHAHGDLGHTVQVTGKSGLSHCWVGEAGQAGRTTLCTGGQG